MATFNGTSGNNTLTGGSDDDILNGLAGNDVLFGGAGNDALNGGDNNDTLNGGNDNDTLNGGAGADSMDGGDGFDLVDYSASGSAVTVNLALGTGAGGEADGDTLFNIEAIRGSSLADSLTGNDFDNLLIGGAGGDTLDGGLGVDTVDYSASASGVSINLGVGAASGGDATGDRLISIENVIGTASNDTLTGSSDDNVLTGGAGNDALNGALGADTMIGGTGDDTFTVDNTGDVVSESSGQGNDLVFSSIDYVLGANVERLQLTGSTNLNGDGNELDNVLTGNSGGTIIQGMNILRGFAGNDTIFGMGGGDVLDGGTGNDSMVGGTGSDLYVIDSVGDVMVESANEGTDTVQSSTLSFTLATNFEDARLTGSLNLNATGNAVDNRIEGNSGNNVLTGLAGDDTLIGNDGNDTLDGGANADDMTGGDGDDTYYVDHAADQVIEASDGGIDTVHTTITKTMWANVENLIMDGTANINTTGNSENNNILGNSGNNSISGGNGNDTIDGGAGNDTIDGGIGNDSMTGGAGDDLIKVNSTDDIVVERLGEGNDTVEAGASWTMSDNIETLVQTGSSSINATGNSQNNTIYGNSGQNILMGLAGNDTIYGGSGADTLDGGTGNDSMEGGISNDYYIIDSIGDVVVEALNQGTDTVEVNRSYTLLDNFENLILTGSALDGAGNALNNQLTGNANRNELSGGDGNDSLYGGDNRDTLDGGAGNDSLVGGRGYDTYYVDARADKVIELADEGIDTVISTVSWDLGVNLEDLTLTGSDDIYANGNTEDNLLTGNSGHNQLLGQSGLDTLYGGAGNDSLNGGQGADDMYGGLGDDTFVVGSTGDVIHEDANEGIDLVKAHVSYVLGDNFENLEMSGSGRLRGTGNELDNQITGNGGANELYGLAGDDSLYGGGGSDELDGGTGNDYMEGGLGNDFYYVDSADDVIVELSGGGVDKVYSEITYTLADQLEKLKLTGVNNINGTGNSVNNQMVGNNADNYLSGEAGNDTLVGNAGNDTLDGGTGNDSMVGGAGDDVYIVDSTRDKVVEVAGEGSDLVNSSVTFKLGSTLENLTLTGSDNIDGEGNSGDNLLIGNSGDNELIGSAGNDTLTGNDGNDILDGGTGDDTMVGGDGDDIYVVDSASDVVIELDNQGTDTLQTTLSATLSNGVSIENLTLTGSSGASATGNDFDNVITGNSGSNLLDGGLGADTMIGGSGSDTITGGEGADHFVFTSGITGTDTIVDFNALDGGSYEGDVLEFVGLLHGSFTYVGASGFTSGGNTEARFQGDAIIMDFDGNGTGDMTIRFTGLTSDNQINGGDFFFS